MFDVYVRTATGKVQEVLLSHSNFKIDFQTNVSWNCSFSAFLNDKSKTAYDLIQNENIIIYEGQQYVIKELSLVDEWTKEVFAQHIAWEFQNHILAASEEEQKNVKYTLKQYLEKSTKGNIFDYSFVIHGSFPTITFENDIGGKNGIELIKEACEQFGCFFYPDNKILHLYSENMYYKSSEVTLRYLFNTKDVKVSVNTNELRTRIKAYGKKKTTNGKYSIRKTTDLTLNGTFIKTGTWYAENPTLSTSFSANVNASYDGDSIFFDLKQGNHGGIVELFFDGKNVGKYSQWSSSSKSRQIIITNNASKGNHVITCKFSNEDSEHKMSSKTVTEYITDVKTGKKVKVTKQVKTPNWLYVGTATGNVAWGVYNTTGNNKYYAFVDYISPNANLYGIREANSVFEEKYSDDKALLEFAKKQILDVPETSLELTYTGTEDLNPRDTIRFIHEPLGFNTDLKVVSITKPHGLSGQPITVNFSNTKKDIVKIQQRIAQMAKSASLRASNSINSITMLQDSISDQALESEVVGEVEDI
ncbi:hypothetical protein HCJ24_13825 [Listeria welshimeri]|nr:hypothetical protein [Listeria welshimeri]MBC1962650.1 hypothetical protein [Listeria welshimeri]